MTGDKIELWFLIGDLSIGGAERTLVDLVSHIDKNKFAVTVWTIIDGGELVNDLPNEVEYRTLNATGKWDILAPFRFFFRVKVENPDILNSFLFFDNTIARAIGLVMAEPSVITGVREVPNSPPWLRSYLDRKTQNWSDMIVSNSEAGAEYCIDRGAPPEKVQVIQNGRDIDQYLSGHASEKLYQELSINMDAPVVGTVGRLIKRKGHYDLLNGWPSVLDTNPKVQLLFIGDGPEKEPLKKKARELNCRDSVVFAGQRDDVPDLLDMMDIFVFPSHFEGLPGALMEAMIAGLPIVATPVDGNSELIENGETGLFVSPHDSEEIANRLVELLNNPDQQHKLGNRATEYAREQYTIEKMVSQFESIYEKLSI